MKKKNYNWDIGFLLFLQDRVRNPFLNRFWQNVTRWGNGSYGWLLLGSILTMIPSTRPAGVRTFEAIVFGEFLINLVIKISFNRTRPYVRYPELKVVGNEMHDTSFPSGHTAMGFLLVAVYASCMPVYFTLGVIGIASMVAFSRMYLGVHYPTDILGGIVIGIGLGYFITRFCFPLVDRILAEPMF